MNEEKTLLPQYVLQSIKSRWQSIIDGKSRLSPEELGSYLTTVIAGDTDFPAKAAEMIINTAQSRKNAEELIETAFNLLSIQESQLVEKDHHSIYYGAITVRIKIDATEALKFLAKAD